MPNCFSLSRRTGGGPVPLVKIDEEMCLALGQPCDPKKYYADWYVLIGFNIALGIEIGDLILQTEAVIAEGTEVEYYTRLLSVLTWLDKNFESEAWYGC